MPHGARADALRALSAAAGTAGTTNLAPAALTRPIPTWGLSPQTPIGLNGLVLNRRTGWRRGPGGWCGPRPRPQSPGGPEMWAGVGGARPPASSWNAGRPRAFRGAGNCAAGPHRPSAKELRADGRGEPGRGPPTPGPQPDGTPGWGRARSLRHLPVVSSFSRGVRKRGVIRVGPSQARRRAASVSMAASASRPTPAGSSTRHTRAPASSPRPPPDDPLVPPHRRPDIPTAVEERGAEGGGTGTTPVPAIPWPWIEPGEERGPRRGGAGDGGDVALGGHISGGSVVERHGHRPDRGQRPPHIGDLPPRPPLEVGLGGGCTPRASRAATRAGPRRAGVRDAAAPRPSGTGSTSRTQRAPTHHPPLDPEHPHQPGRHGLRRSRSLVAP